MIINVYLYHRLEPKNAEGVGQLRDRAERKGFYKEAGHILQMLVGA
jgi:hypothetical protein